MGNTTAEEKRTEFHVNARRQQYYCTPHRLLLLLLLFRVRLLSCKTRPQNLIIGYRTRVFC